MWHTHTYACTISLTLTPSNIFCFFVSFPVSLSPTHTGKKHGNGKYVSRTDNVYERALSLTHKHHFSIFIILSLLRAHTHTHTRSLPHTLSLSHTHANMHTCTHRGKGQQPQNMFRGRTNIYERALSLSHTHYISLSHTRTPCFSLYHSLSLARHTHTHTHTHIFIQGKSRARAHSTMQMATCMRVPGPTICGRAGVHYGLGMVLFFRCMCVFV